MSGENKKSPPSKLVIISTFFSALTALFLAVNTWIVSTFNSQIKETESQRTLSFRIFDSVSGAVESNNPKRIRAARTIVNVMSPDELKSDFLAILEEGEVEIFEQEEVDLTESVKPFIDQNNEVSELPVIVHGEHTYNWGDIDVDLFWCSSSGISAQTNAESLKGLLRAVGAIGRIRVRILPESTRSRSGYKNVKNFQVMAEANELEMGNALVKLANENLNLEPQFKLVEINPNKKTRWYLSAFLCP